MGRIEWGRLACSMPARAERLRQEIGGAPSVELARSVIERAAGR